MQHNLTFQTIFLSIVVVSYFILLNHLFLILVTIMSILFFKKLTKAKNKSLDIAEHKVITAIEERRKHENIQWLNNQFLNC